MRRGWRSRAARPRWETSSATPPRTEKRSLPTAWWHNLQRDPRASVLIRGTTSRVTARAATAEEHDRLWPLVTETNPGYARYQRRTARPIPIVLLRPERE